MFCFILFISFFFFLVSCSVFYSIIYDVYSLVFGSVLLLLCSVVCNYSYKSWVSGNLVVFVLLMRLCCCLMFGFVVFQYFEYTSGTFHMLSGVYGSIFYSLTGIHGLHVIVGVLLLLRLLFVVHRFYSLSFVFVQLKLTLLYVHVVDAVWVVLLIFVYMPIWNS